MEQVISGGYYDLLSRTATEYNSLIGGYTWTTAGGWRFKAVSADGVIKQLRVKLSGAPGVGNKYTFTLLVNGFSTDLTFDIADLETAGGDMVNEIAVTGGDTVLLGCDPDSNPTAVYATWDCVFVSDAPYESLLMGGSGFGLNNAATEYVGVMGGASNHTITENDHRQIIPTAGTIKNLYVQMNIDPGVGADAYRFTLRKNGANQTLTVTIVANDTSGEDLVNSFAVAAGDVLTMMIEPLNGPAEEPYARWGMTFVADTDGESIVLGGSSDNLPQVDTEYHSVVPSYYSEAWTANENERYHLGQICTLKKLYVLLSGSPGAGNKYDFTIRLAGAGSNVVTTIADAATTGNSGALEGTVVLDEYVDLEVVPTDTPDIRDAYWGFVCYIPPPRPIEQVIFGGFYNLLHATNTEYNLLNGGAAWGPGGIFTAQMVSTDGVIKNFRVRLSGAPGVGTHYTFTLYLNGAPTALTFDIADLETSGSNMVDEVTVTGGDTVQIQCDPDGTPAQRYAYWTTVFRGDIAGESLVLSGATDFLDSGSTEYAMVMSSRTTPSNVENDHREIVPTSGTIKNLYVRLSTDPGTAPDAYRFTLRKGGISQTLTVTITADDTTGNDLVNSFAVAAGDVLTMMIEPLNGPSATPLAYWGMTFVADIDDESIVMGMSTDDLHSTISEYHYLSAYEISTWVGTEAQRRSLGQTCTLRKLHVLLSAAPGAGNDRDFALRIEGTNVVTLQISDAALTGDSGVLSDTVANDEYVILRTIPTGSPDVADAYWGFVCWTPPFVDGSADLLGRAIIRRVGTIDLPGKVGVQQPRSTELFGRFDIQATADLLGKVVVRDVGSAEVLVKTEIRQSDSAELLGKAEARQSGSAEVLSRFEVGGLTSSELSGKFEVGQDSEGLLGRLTVRHSTSVDLPAKSITRHADDLDLPSVSEITNLESADRLGKLVVRHVIALVILCKFTVRQPASVDLLGGVEVGRLSGVDLAAKSDIMHSVSLLGSSVIRHVGAPLEFSARCEIRHTGIADLLGKFTIRRSGSANLGTVLGITHSRALPGRFKVPQDSVGLLGKFAIGRDSKDLFARFEAQTTRDLLARAKITDIGSTELLGKTAIKQVGAPVELFARFEVGQDSGALKALFLIPRAYDFSGSMGISFYWWGSGGMDQNIDFEMSSLTGGWVGEFPDGPAEWRQIQLSWDDLTEVDLDGTRPDRRQIIGFYWTYHTSGVRRLAGIQAWMRQNLFGKFFVRNARSSDLLGKFEAQTTAELLGKGIIRHLDTVELLGRAEVGQNSADLLGKFEAQATLDLLGKVDITHSVDLFGKFDVGQATAELLGRAEIRLPGSAELPAKFEAQVMVELLGKVDIVPA